jgi:glyoxylase-like metal-dependent hydrolase (beta-lactamase superfamily II)
MKVLWGLLLWLSVTAGSAVASDISIIRLADGAYLLNSKRYGTNIGLIQACQGAVLIDPMPGEEQLEALNTLVRQRIGSQTLYLLNTHQHEDHTGGNSYFISRGAKVVTSTLECAEIQSLTLKSHSSSDTVFFHPSSNTIFVGDIYDTHWHPTFYAGGLTGFVQAVDAILQLGDAQSLILPGHGQPSGKAQLRAFKQNTLDWVAKVKALRQAGLQISDIQHDHQIKAVFQRFNLTQRAVFVPEKAFIRFIERTVTLLEQDQQSKL